MIYNYLKENYDKGDPIFFEELPCSSKKELHWNIKRLIETGELNCVCKGVYYLPYKTMLGTDGGMSILKYVEKKYIQTGDNVFGYMTGLQLVNRYGFSTQNSAFIEVCSNKATTRQRKCTVDGMRIIIYKPKTKITTENAIALQFLDLLSLLDTFCEIQGEELVFKIKRFINWKKVQLSMVKQYLPFYPAEVCKYLALTDISGVI